MWHWFEPYIDDQEVCIRSHFFGGLFVPARLRIFRLRVRRFPGRGTTQEKAKCGELKKL